MNAHEVIDYSFVICPKCGSMPAARVTVCPACNFSHPIKEVAVEVVVPIKPVTPAPTITITPPNPVEVPGTAP